MTGNNQKFRFNSSHRLSYRMILSSLILTWVFWLLMGYEAHAVSSSSPSVAVTEHRSQGVSTGTSSSKGSLKKIAEELVGNDLDGVIPNDEGEVRTYPYKIVFDTKAGRKTLSFKDSTRVSISENSKFIAISPSVSEDDLPRDETGKYDHFVGVVDHKGNIRWQTKNLTGIDGISNDGNLAVQVDLWGEGKVKLFKAQNNSVVNILIPNVKDFFDQFCQFSSDGKYLLIKIEDSSLRIKYLIVETMTGRMVFERESRGIPPCSVAMTSDARYLVAVVMEEGGPKWVNHFQVFDVFENRMVWNHTIKGEAENITDIKIDNINRLAYLLGTVSIYEIDIGKKAMKKIFEETSSRVSFEYFAMHNKFLAVSALNINPPNDYHLYVLDKNGALLDDKLYEAKRGGISGLSQISVTPSGQIFLRGKGKIHKYEIP